MQPITIPIPINHPNAGELSAVCEDMLANYGWHHGTSISSVIEIFGSADSSLIRKLELSAQQNQYTVSIDQEAA